MKKTINYIYAAAVAVLLMSGCGKDEKEVNTLSAADVFTSGCVQTFDKEDESWNVYWNRGKLIVAHTGWMVPCDLHDVAVDVELDGSVVTIDECGEGGAVNCICDMHNSFTIAGLSHGTYTFVFKVCGEEQHRQEFTI